MPPENKSLKSAELDLNRTISSIPLVKMRIKSGKILSRIFNRSDVPYSNLQAIIELGPLTENLLRKPPNKQLLIRASGDTTKWQARMIPKAKAGYYFTTNNTPPNICLYQISPRQLNLAFLWWKD